MFEPTEDEEEDEDDEHFDDVETNIGDLQEAVVTDKETEGALESSIGLLCHRSLNVNGSLR